MADQQRDRTVGDGRRSGTGFANPGELRGEGKRTGVNGSYTLGNSPNTMVASVQALDTWANGATIITAINLSVTRSNTTDYSVTAGRSSLTIDGSATPPISEHHNVHG